MRQRARRTAAKGQYRPSVSTVSVAHFATRRKQVPPATTVWNHSGPGRACSQTRRRMRAAARGKAIT